jgi:hypothetical protein
LKGKNFGFKDDDLLKYMTGATLIPRPENEDDVLNELDKSETELVDETAIQVQVPEQLDKSEDAEAEPLTEEQKTAEEALISIPNLETGTIEYLKELTIEEPEILAEAPPAELKPYPNEHACRLADPGDFDKFARKNCFRKVSEKCVDYIFGIKDDKSKVQALRFNKDVWDASAAKSVCERVGGSFEAAKPSKAEDPPAETPNTEPTKLEVDFSAEIVRLNGEIQTIKEILVVDNENMTAMSAQIKGIQESLAKALEEIQRKPRSEGGTSSLILQDAFAQGKVKTDVPAPKFSKESLDGLKLALLELGKALKTVNL